MVKHFNIIMAALISGTVALFTSVLGVSGTVIGAVLSSFLYQLLSGYSEEKYDAGALRKPKLANEIVYIFPLVVIGIIELIFLLSALHYRFYMILDILESAVANNLFRLMGIGLIILGAYPYFDSNNIDKRNGTVVLSIGVLLLLRGLMDITDITSKIFYALFYRFDYLFALFVVISLVVVILNILIGSGNLKILGSDGFINNHKPKTGARKVDTSFNEDASSDTSFNKDVSLNGDMEHDTPNDDYDNFYDDSNYDDSYINHKKNPKQPPIYKEEIILVNNPDDPNNPIKKRILKRVKQDNDYNDHEDYDDMYIVDEID